MNCLCGTFEFCEICSPHENVESIALESLKTSFTFTRDEILGEPMKPAPTQIWRAPDGTEYTVTADKRSVTPEQSMVMGYWYQIGDSEPEWSPSHPRDRVMKFVRVKE